MASVPNMRPTASVTGGDGKAAVEGAGVTTPFASLLATGRPTPAGADGATEGVATKSSPAAQLLAALQRALSGRVAPQADEAPPAGSEPAEMVVVDGDGAGGDDDAAVAEAAGAPAELLPLIEAQSAAPVPVAVPVAVRATPASPPAGSATPGSEASAGEAGRLTLVAGAAPVSTPASPLVDPAPSPTGAPHAPDPTPPAAARPGSPAIDRPEGDTAPAKAGPRENAPLPGAAPAGADAGAGEDRLAGRTPRIDPGALTPDLKVGPPSDSPLAPSMVARLAAAMQARLASARPGDAASRGAAAPATPAPGATDAAAASPAPVSSGSSPLAALQALFTHVAPPPAAQPGPGAADAPAGGGAPARPLADRLMEHHLDLARDSAWLDRLARDIATSAEGGAPMRFRLHPETLGHMRVELSQGDRGMSVRLTVENEAARHIIADAQPRLLAEARAQGVRLAEAHVDLAGGAGGHASGDPRHQDMARDPVSLRTARAAPGADEDVDVPSRRRDSPDRYA